MGEGHILVTEAGVAHMAVFLAKPPQLVEDGLVRPLPLKLWEGKMSAENIVYRV